MDKAHKALPEVEITVGGKTHSVVGNFGMLCRFEKATGLNPFDAKIWASPGPGLIAALVWAALAGKDRALKLEDVEDMLSFNDIQVVEDLIQGLFTNAQAELPSGAEEKKAQ